MLTQILRIPKAKMALVLLVISAATLLHYFSFVLLTRLILSVAFMLAVEFAFWKARRVDFFLPSASIVSSLIIFLLAAPETPLLQVFIALIAAAGLKQFVRPAGTHIFNPAVSGLVVAGFLDLPITWWGVSWGLIPLIIILLGAGYVSLVIVRQYTIVGPFLLVSFLISALLVASLPQALNQFLVSSYWFFALVMLPEPITGAHRIPTKIIYGVFVAAFQFILPHLFFTPDPLLASLLIGNGAVRAIELLKPHSA